ncbi:apoptosome protein Dark isoform X2 [Halictus rubicundus]|uniref:apoptosome protein Dark isoform X2 n=1 Tax=Halictus rubicundus TaxID=77578 RepID=UPI0040374F0D
MDRLHKNILKELRSNIVIDVDIFNGIIQPLQSEYILSKEDVANIEAGINKQERAEILLDILPSRGADAFDKFRQSLRHHYEWISLEMDQREENGKTVTDIKYVSPPNLPPLSPLTVSREQKLKYHLEKLKPNEYVVLHGIKGFGKSCLTASTLKDTKFVRNTFNNEIYWLKFGYTCSVDEEILIQLNKLYHQVKNMEMLPETLKPESLKNSLIHFLKHHFAQEKNSHALLILDDVCNSKIIKVFDFECKTLVTTADLDIVWDKRPSVIEMSDGFTEAETLGLFAKVLGTEVDKLPLEAKRIHSECKGMPLLIAMFSAQFEEFKHDMKLRPDRWRYYLNSLKNKDVENRVIKKFLEKQEVIFNMCIEQLPDEMKKHYQELVIFREDINITPQTLEILWDEQVHRVEEMMLELCHKSLAAKQWNNELRSYIYGVHDLLLCHLRKKISEDKLTQMHKSLIEKYRKKCNGDFSKLPADNYSYSYIGYHLKEAKLYDEFPKIYLNFDFIQATIIHSGLTNLLIDLDNYREYVTRNSDPLLDMHLTDLERFLKEQAGVIAKYRYKKCLDIVQVAMNHPYEGFVKDTAMKLAKERSKNLYLLHKKRMGQMHIPWSEEMLTEICTTCFANDPDLILVGNGTGEIFLCNSISKGRKTFSGHDRSRRIKKIVVSTERDCFLSLDDHGIVKLFRLDDDEDYDENNLVLSPKRKQSYWSEIFTSEVPHDDSSKVFFIDGEIILDMTFAQNNNYIAVCTNKGTIKVWDRDGHIISTHTHHFDSQLKSIVSSEGSNLLHIMDETNGVLISYRRYSSEYKYLSQYNPGLQNKKIIFFCNEPEQNNSLFIVTEDKAVHLKWFQLSNDHSYDQMHSYKKQIRASVDNENTVFVCGALTYDGQYLILADSSGFINIWKADVGQQPIATYKSRVSSLDTYWLKEEGYHIICGCENQSLHKWILPVEGISKSMKKPLFDAAVQPLYESDTIITETFSNTVVTLVGDKIVAESKPVNGKITNLILSSDRSKIVFVTDEGIVTLFDIDQKETINVLKNTELIKMINIQNKDVIICREKDNHLRVWQNKDVTYLVENTGFVISIHEINEKCIVTVTRSGIITLWIINGTNWLRIDRVTIGGSDTITTFSCLSHGKAILAVLNENGDVVLYTLQEDTITLPVCIRLSDYYRKKYTQKLTCCEISQKEKYLAIGCGNGDISIINISLKVEEHKLCFHTTPITQLYWAPSAVDLPVLLSVNSDELVWWNITLDTHGDKQTKRRKQKLRPSCSFTLDNKRSTNNLYMSSSQSADSNFYSAQQQLEDNTTTNGVSNVSKYWKLKEGKDTKQPALLAAVELASNFLAKVCVSPDFTKFVTVDMYGSISTFSIHGYT